MQWLDGEDLAERLARGPLGIEETIALGIQVAEAVGSAHAQGVVHRDLKPSNVFLVGRRTDQAKLLDFGLAREVAPSRAVTGTGVVVGTVGYLSPEQARGASMLDARTDVFSMGCILFECLTGRPAFSGVHVVATLAKLLVEDPPRVRSLRPDVAGSLDSLVARMLDKRPEARPPDGAAVAAALVAMRSRDSIVAPSAAPSGRLPLTAREQRVMSVILIGQRNEGQSMTGSAAAGDDANARTIISLRAPAARHLIDEAMKRFDGSADAAADGTMVITLQASGSATDQAARAARCALALREACPGAAIALAVGRGVAESGVATGEVIERAAALLAAARRLDSEGVHVEPSLVPLIEDRFAVATGPLDMLQFERASLEPGRVVLGRVTPFVGRARELSTLEQTLAESIEDSVASIVVVLGPAGAGKSRLQGEFLRSARRRHPEATVWFARGDSMRAQSAYGVAAALVRSGASIAEAAPLVEQQERLAAKVAESVHEVAARGRITEFLAEMIGCPYGDEASVQLRAARESSALMRDQIARAWTDLVGGELAQRPILLVAEDAHWADFPSIQLFDVALKAHAQRALVLLAAGRPEVEDDLPKAWKERAQTIRLSPLSPRAAAQLARQVLGVGVDDATIAALAERSGGSPFVIEELVRARASGKGTDALPDSVLAIVQARLESLDPLLRRTLRAASVFGRVAPAAGVATLLGAEVPRDVVDLSLRSLAEREVLEPRPDGAAYQFRHDLVRDAAYAMLTDADRAAGHALAGEWLEDSGEVDGSVLALHYDRGGERERAATSYVRAAMQAIEANDLSTAVVHADRALVLSVDRETRGRAMLASVTARRWMGRYEGTARIALEALDLLPSGTQDWFRSLQVASAVAEIVGDIDAQARVRDLVSSAVPATEAAAAVRIGVLVHSAVSLFHSGDTVAADDLAARIDVDAAPMIDRHLLVAAAFHRLKTIQTTHAGDVSAALEHWLLAAASYGAAGERWSACTARTNAAFTMLQLGMNEEGEAGLRQAQVEARAIELLDVAAAAQQNLCLVLARRGALDEALTEGSEALAVFIARGNRRMVGATRVYLSLALLLRRDLERAESEARQAIVDLEAYGLARPSAIAQLARVLVARGKLDEALAFAEEALAAAEAGPVDDGDVAIRLTHAEVLHAVGREVEARAALLETHRRLLEQAARIADPARRERFLSGVPDHARIIALARESS